MARWMSRRKRWRWPVDRPLYGDRLGVKLVPWLFHFYCVRGGVCVKMMLCVRGDVCEKQRYL